MKQKTVSSGMVMLLALLMLNGCAGRHYVMPRPDMSLAPAVDDLPQAYTIATFALNPILDLAEGGDGRFAWTSVMWNKLGQETRLLALSLTNFTGDKVLLTIIPRPLSEVLGSRLAVIDHGGKRIYNHKGEYRELDSLSRKINPAKYEDFLPVIGDNAVTAREVTRGSDEDKSLSELYKEFRLNDVKIARKYVYTRYGSISTQAQLDRISREDSIVRGLADWLGRDWKIFVMYPFMDLASTGITTGIAKVFTLPSIWGDRLDRPGYMEFRPDAEFVAKMLLRGLQEYGQTQTPVLTMPNTTAQPLSDDIKAAIKGTPCQAATTYTEYNACVLRINRTIK